MKRDKFLKATLPADPQPDMPIVVTACTDTGRILAKVNGRIGEVGTTSVSIWAMGEWHTFGYLQGQTDLHTRIMPRKGRLKR